VQNAVVSLFVVVDVGVALLNVHKQIDLVLSTAEQRSLGDQRANCLEVVLSVLVAFPSADQNCSTVVRLRAVG
jgi:hypothetical protein